MPLSQALPAFLTQEWARFAEGYDQLTDVEKESYLRDYRRSKASPDGSTLISIPGWSEIVRTSAPYQPTVAEVREFYQARRQSRTPDLPPYVAQEIQRRHSVKERIARSPEPAYAQAFGSILTALDNVQDFMSSVATTGRLALWGLPAASQFIFPGASQGTATALAEVAARRAAATTAATFAETVATRAAAGNLVARLALVDSALFAAARREAVETAAQLAYRLAFSRATLGLAGRLAARFVPVLGWVILASDLLNLLSFAAMMATPVYALLCGGPQAALAAGVPGALFKQSLKRETWRAHNLNPFSRTARASRALRAAGRLPTLSNLVEVAQTTDQVFGIGLSLGGLVGLLNGATFGLYEWSQGRSVSFTGPPEVARAVPDLAATGAQADPQLAALLRGELPREFQDPAAARAARSALYAQRRALRLPPSSIGQTATGRMVQQAAGVAATAPAVFAVQSHFTEEEHVLVLLAYLQAVATLRALDQGDALADAVPAALDAHWPAPLSVAPDTALWAEATGRDLERGRRWWFGAGAETATGAEYVEHHARAIPAALRDFLMPRRNAPIAALYGAAFGEAGETAWLLAENDPELFHFALATDARLLSSLSEEGYILAHEQEPARVWRWWQAARAELERDDGTSLRPGRWSALAEQFGVGLIRLLPTSSPVPAAWDTGSGPFSAPEPAESGEGL